MKRIPAERRQLTERQRQIVEAAIRLIAKDGLACFTTKNLAKAVKVSEPAIYRHFDNKEAIIGGLVRYLNERTQELFTSSDTDKNYSALELLGMKNKRLMEFFKDNIFFARASANQAVYFPQKDIVREANRMQESLFAHEKALAQRGQQEGTIRADIDSGDLVKIIMGTNFSEIHFWLTAEHHYDLVAEWRRVWRSIEVLIAAPGKGRPAVKRKG
jgi:AcrR family transcriptional regulator